MTTEEKLAALEAEVAAKNAELAAVAGERDQFAAESEKARQEAERLKSAVGASKKTGIVSLPVAGSYKAEWKNPQTGKKESRLVEFKDGRQNVILPKLEVIPNMAGATVPSEGLLALANGEKPTAAQLDKFPALAALNEETAQAVLIHYAAIKAGFLK